ncbi:MAG: hypothetical protein M1814_005600 [Vezdaea aestivalis]|nr:MAG: hypothetical protein M1814_005600 [Vezdaea aestivalis]
MAEKYVLKVTAGPAYDSSTHSVVNVNSPTPLRISTPSIDINLTVRVQNFRGLPSNSPKTSPYFSAPSRTRDQYSIALSLLPKKPIRGQDLIFGNDFDNPIRDKLPPGFGTAFKIVKWAIDPGLDGDPYADEPHLYGGALSSFNVLRVGVKADKLKDVKEVGESVLEEGADGDGDRIRKAADTPDDAGPRKKHFLDKAHQEKFEFEAGRIYELDFFNPYIDFNDFALKLPGFTLPVVSFWESKDIPLRRFGLVNSFVPPFGLNSAHKLRYVLRNRETKEVYFVVLFTLLLREEVEKEETHHNADNENTTGIDDGGVD